MYVTHLSLTNFRLYARLETELPRGLIVVQGDNAQGKTSLLEAIYFLATAHSPYASADRQIIRWGAEEDGPFPSAAMRASVQRNDGAHTLEMVLQKGEGGRLRKDIRVDRAQRRGADLVGQLSVVLFLPHDVDLVSGAPALRRAFLDDALGQVDAEYVRALDRFEKTLTQRNALLRQAQERRIDPDELLIWDEQLVPAGVQLALARRKALGELTERAAPIHRELSNSLEFLQIAYQPNFDPARPPASDAYQIALDASRPPEGMSTRDIERAYRSVLADRRSEELARGQTLIGPHRDEFRFVANGMDLGDYGSRGQQRTAVLALKLAQVEWMRQCVNEEPVLLLDEVLAELDPHRRRCLLARIGHSQQTIITTTDIQRYDEAFVREAKRMSVIAGVVRNDF